MRDLLVAAFILLSLPVCFRRPFIGLLVFTLLAYMRVQDLTWGFARFERWSFYVAVVTFAGFVLHKGDRKFMSGDLRNWIMIALAAVVGISLLASGGLDARDLASYSEYAKIIGVALFTTGVVVNREYLRILVYVIALSFAFYGVKNGLAFLLSGGSLVVITGPGGMLADNNDFALALVMGIPMVLHLGLAEERKLLRRSLLLCVPLMVMAIVATHSRGAFVSLAAMTLVLAWRARNRVASFSVIGLAVLAGVLAAPSAYVERIGSITEYQEDGSAQGRLAAWKVAGAMIVDRPLFGVGFDKFQRNYRDYDENVATTSDAQATPTGTRVAHNSYLQVWAECGSIAFAMYMILLVYSLWDLSRVRRAAQARYHTSWILSYANMFEAALVAFAVGSMFLNRAHFDLFYHFVAIISVFGAIARAEIATAPEREPAMGATRPALRAAPADGFGPRARLGGFGQLARRGGFARAATGRT
ncbi:MAG: hypothetical protein RL112_1709 [Planctomycetota bacterium]|jgi:probable O-glycosylation ligase (exosortase A-associated)